MNSVTTPSKYYASADSVVQSTHRQPGITLYRYLVREMTFPTAYTLLGLTAVVLTRDLLRFSDLVINRGLSPVAVAWMAFYQIVPLLAQMLPFATLVGCLVALGRLGADREILVLEASGISAPRLVGPVMGFATIACVFGLGLSLLGAPAAQRALDASLVEAARSNPAATIQSGRVHWFGAWKMEALEVSARGDQMRGVLLRMPEISETVFAERGSLAPDPAGGTRVTLQQGAVLLNPRKQLRELRFASMTTHLPETERMVARSEVDQLGGYRLDELGQAAMYAEPPELAHQALIEMHRRFAMPLATLVFGFLVVPLFFSRKHFSRSSGGVMGILAILTYYGLVQVGDGLEQAGRLSVALGVWLPNLVLGAVAIVLVFRLTRLSTFARGAESVRPVAKQVTPGPRARRGAHPRQFALQRYVAGRFAQMVAVCFCVVLVAYLMVDVLERLQLFAGYGATGWEVLRYYGARIPILASRVVPMSLLVATALTVSVLAVQGELMGMRACGIPAARALLPILVICALIVPAYFVLNNEILPRANAMASYVKQVEIKNRDDGSGARSIWYRTGTRVYEVERFDPQAGTARSITVYDLGERGLPVSRLDATSARHIGNGIWRLGNPVRVARSEAGLRQVEAPPFADLGEELPAEVDTRKLSVGELRREIAEVEASGYDATAYRVDLYVKLAAPIACLVLPALALFFAVAGPPHPSSALTLVASVVVAVAYVLLTGVGTSLGYGGAVSPIVAGWGPPGAFALLGAYLGLRLRGFGQSF